MLAEGLRKSFDKKAALDGFDLAVPAGTVCGLLGPNGAGKTTAVRILATLLRLDGGHAEVAGFDVAREAPQVRRQVALNGQQSTVDDVLTGKENLVMWGRLYHLSKRQASARADELLEQFGLTDAADKRAKQYSGGMRRRLDLASSFITRPSVLFLDEPTTGLDPRNRGEVWREVKRVVAEGTTVLLTRYADCEGDSEVAYWAIAGGGHTWPGSSVPSGGLLGRTSLDLSASDSAVRFFLDHHR